MKKIIFASIFILLAITVQAHAVPVEILSSNFHVWANTPEASYDYSGALPVSGDIPYYGGGGGMRPFGASGEANWFYVSAFAVSGSQLSTSDAELSITFRPLVTFQETSIDMGGNGTYYWFGGNIGSWVFPYSRWPDTNSIPAYLTQVFEAGQIYNMNLRTHIEAFDDSSSFFFSVADWTPVSPVPLPTSLILFASGLAGLTCLRRKIRD